MRGVRTLVATAAVLFPAAPAAAASTTIDFGGSLGTSYSPTPTQIKTGDTAAFSGDFMTHPLIWDHGEFDTTNMGAARGFSFAAPGTYTYHCMVHQSQGMVGTITVVADQHPARVAFGVSPAPGAGKPVTFTYSGDADPDGSLVRWDWDLDGDGTFETSTPAGAVTTTYASARTVTVSMRAVDDSGEPSATASQAVVIAPAGVGGAGGGGGAGSGGSTGRDVTAPRASALRLSGLKLSLRASERASATATLRARGKTIARGSTRARSRTITIRLKLTKAGRALLPRGARRKAKLTLTLRDAAGNRRTVTRSLTVRRP